MSAVSEGAAGETTGAAATKAGGAPRDRRGLRRACAARRLHRPDLRHVAAVAGRVRHRLCGAGAVAHLLLGHDGEPANSLGASFRAARRAAGARGGHGAVGHRLSRGGRERRFLDIGDRAFDRRARLQHAASARVGAGCPCLCRTARDEGARHLQFRGRHRQDVGAGAGLADAAGAVVAADRCVYRPARHRGGGGDLRPCAAPAGRCGSSRGRRSQGGSDRHGRAAQPLWLPAAAGDRHGRQRHPHGLPDLPAVHPDRQGREPAHGGSCADIGVCGRRGRQARLRFHRRARRRDRHRVSDRRADHRRHPVVAAAAAGSRADRVAGHWHHAQRHVVSALRLGAGAGGAGKAHAHVRHLLHRDDRRGRRVTGALRSGRRCDRARRRR